MRNTLTIRDIQVKLNGEGFIVSIGDLTEKLKPVEAEILFEQLLKTLPGVSDRVALAWSNRHSPWIKLIGYYGLEGDELVVNKWKGEVYICEELAFYTRGFMSKEQVVETLRNMYGKEMQVRKEEIYEVSRLKAQEELAIKRATAYAEANGMTLDELWREAMRAKKAGEI